MIGMRLPAMIFARLRKADSRLRSIWAEQEPNCVDVVAPQNWKHSGTTQGIQGEPGLPGEQGIQGIWESPQYREARIVQFQNMVASQNRLNAQADAMLERMREGRTEPRNPADTRPSVQELAQSVSSMDIRMLAALIPSRASARNQRTDDVQRVRAAQQAQTEQRLREVLDLATPPPEPDQPRHREPSPKARKLVTGPVVAQEAVSMPEARRKMGIFHDK